MATALLLVVATGVACRDAERRAFETKCDAPLRLRVEGLARTAPDSLLDVLGRTDGGIDEARRGKLESAGARLGQVTEDLFTAGIPVKRIGTVAALGFVTSLALSQERAPLSP